MILQIWGCSWVSWCFESETGHYWALGCKHFSAPSLATDCWVCIMKSDLNLLWGEKKQTLKFFIEQTSCEVTPIILLFIISSFSLNFFFLHIGFSWTLPTKHCLQSKQTNLPSIISNLHNEMTFILIISIKCKWTIDSSADSSESAHDSSASSQDNGQRQTVLNSNLFFRMLIFVTSKEGRIYLDYLISLV